MGWIQAFSTANPVKVVVPEAAAGGVGLGLADFDFGCFVRREKSVARHRDGGATTFSEPDSKKVFDDLEPVKLCRRAC